MFDSYKDLIKELSLDNDELRNKNKELQCDVDKYKRYCDDLLKVNYELNRKLAMADELIEKNKQLIDLCNDAIELVERNKHEQ